ncbi:MAG: penicillin-binding protein 2 [Desulfovibrionaceae bacterium]|nr:penicillin-binding protein 2 [Desulfovibrionaceae bacterium]
MSTFYEVNEQQTPKSGLLLLQVLILGLFCLFSVRLWYLQVHLGGDFAEKARQNQLRQESVYAPRGLIRDRNGVLVAVNEPAYALGLVREDCRDVGATLEAVARLTGTPLSALRETYRRKVRRVKPFEPLILLPDLSFDRLAVIEANNLRWPGLEIMVRPRRRYKYGDLLAHILGYVAEANEEELEKDPGLSLGDNVGKQGLERMIEERIRGRKGLNQLEVDVSGRRLAETLLTRPQAGEDVRLSIDLGLQSMIAGILEGKAGAVVVMEPDSGQVLALVSAPSFDGNDFSVGLSPEQWQALRDDPMHPLQNRAIQSVYPPGSVFKLVMAGCGLREGLLDPAESVFCTGSIRLGKHEFRCWRKGGHGRVALERAIVESCDVYFYKLGMRLGVDRVSRFAKACGFGALTGIGLPHEKPGNIPSRGWKLQRFGERWQKGEDLNLAIGQGYTLVSPLQVARFLCAMLNGGWLLRPHLLADQAPERQANIPLNDEHRGRIQEAMVATVEDPQGTARRLRTRGLVIGAKTGTAQVVRLTDELKDMKDHEIPYEYRDHAWMAGFAEKDGRRYVAVAMVEHGGHGSSGAGPVLKAVFEHVFSKGFLARPAPGQGLAEGSDNGPN